jgi:hypothetical protein
MEIDVPSLWLPGRFSNFISSRQCAYGKLEKERLDGLWGHPWKLLVRHSGWETQMISLLSQINPMKVEHNMPS